MARELMPLNKDDIEIIMYYTNIQDEEINSIMGMKFVELYRLKEAKEGFIAELQKDSHNPYATFNKWFGGVLK